MKIENLTQITFTGVDRWTDIDRLVEIQQEYPLVEFGVLLSRNWAENGNRYFDPAELGKLNKPLNLSCHLCGAIARKAILNDFGPVKELCGEYFGLFKRAQLNIATNHANPDKLVLDVPFTLDEVIIQQKSADNCDLFLSADDTSKLSVLLDASGGRGISGDIKVLNGDYKVGYAGGIGPDNIEEKLNTILQSPEDGEFWIDMESKVRTDDKFDLDKVEQTLKIIYSYING